MSRRVSVILLLVALALAPAALAQGSFNFAITITGFERIDGQFQPVTGPGTLRLSGPTLAYELFVPVTRVLPASAHFHGPAVGGETPMISLVPFTQPESGGIVYRGSQFLNSKYLPDIHAGKWYINLHSGDYDNGVLSGYILPIPEPGTVTLFGLGLLTFIPKFKNRARTNSCR